MVDSKKTREWIRVLERLNPDTVDTNVLEATSILIGDLLKAYEIAIEEKKVLEEKPNKLLVNRMVLNLMVLRRITMTKWLQEHHPSALSAWSKYAETLRPLPEVAGPWACPQCSGYLMTKEHLCSCDHMEPTGELGKLNEFIKAKKDAIAKDLPNNPKCPKCEKPMLPALVEDGVQLYGCICDPTTLHPTGEETEEKIPLDEASRLTNWHCKRYNISHSGTKKEARESICSNSNCPERYPIPTCKGPVEHDPVKEDHKS